MEDLLVGGWRGLLGRADRTSRASRDGTTVWYETVLAFLDRYVLDRDWQRPGLL